MSEWSAEKKTLTCSWVTWPMLLLVTSKTSCACCCWNGDCDGEGCSRGLAGIDGDGLGVRNGPGGDRIPVRKWDKHNIFNRFNIHTVHRMKLSWQVKIGRILFSHHISCSIRLGLDARLMFKRLSPNIDIFRLYNISRIKQTYLETPWLKTLLTVFQFVLN